MSQTVVKSREKNGDKFHNASTQTISCKPQYKHWFLKKQGAIWVGFLDISEAGVQLCLSLKDFKF